jgi:WD40 repeat protein/DNA-binding SARP family transcriptional activator
VLRIKLFGSPEVWLEEEKVAGFITVKSRALLFYLAMKPGVHSRQTVATLLWPETTESRAAKNLRNALSNLRKLVGTHLDITRQTVAFKRESEYVLDVEQFSALLERYRRGQEDIGDLETAVSLYTGDFLDGFHVPLSVTYEDWLTSEREQLRQAALTALYSLGVWYAKQENIDASLKHVTHLLTLDYLSEKGQQLQMALLAQVGQRNKAIAHYQAFCLQLEADLSIIPLPETTQLYKEIESGRFQAQDWLLDDGQSPIDYLLSPQSKATLAETAVIPLPEQLPQIDWGEIPAKAPFYGRQEHLQKLHRCLISDQCQLIAITGLGGVGKTTLAATLFRQFVHPDQQAQHNPPPRAYNFLIWRSLINAPPLEEILHMWLNTLSGQQLTDIPATTAEQLSLLLSYLKENRCLLVLDNVESILDGGQQVGQFLAGYEGYAQLLQLLGGSSHQSTLLITSRELPQKFAQLANRFSHVRHYPLLGLPDESGKDLLRAHGLTCSEAKLAQLNHLYSGNPLALQLVADTTQALLAGDVDMLLAETAVFGDIRDILDEQFNRLRPLEAQLLTWLAVEREPVSAQTLWQNLAFQPHKRQFLEALRTLHMRSLITQVSQPNTTDGSRYTLQNVVMEFVTSHLIETVCQEIISGTVNLLHQNALLKAHTREYVQESQRRLILEPVAQWLTNQLGRAGAIAKLHTLRKSLQAESACAPGYAGANILHLLLALDDNIQGTDFSQLTIRQADLRYAILHGVSFRSSDLDGSIFRDTFGIVTTVAFSPAGELLAASATDGSITFWQLHEYQPHLIIHRESGFELDIAFSPDGKLLAGAGNDRIVRVWDVITGQLIHQFEEHTGQITAVVFSSDGSRLYSSSDDLTIRVWDMDSKQLLHQIPTPDIVILALAINPNGRILAGSGYDGKLFLWHTDTGTIHLRLNANNKKIRTLAFNPQGDLLASGGEDCAVRIWQVDNGDQLAVLQLHTNFVLSVAFHPDGNTLASSSADKTIRLWDWREKRTVRILYGSNNWVKSIAYNHDGSILASGGYDRTISLWQSNNGQLLHALKGLLKNINEVSISPDGKWLANAAYDQPVRLWDMHNGRLRHILQGHHSSVRRLVFSPDSTILAVSGDDSEIRLWHTSSGKLLHTFSVDDHFVRTLAFSPNGRFLAIGAGLERGALSIADTKTYHLDSLDQHIRTGLEANLYFSPNGQLLAYGDENHTLKLLNIADNSIQAEISDHQAFISSIQFSPDGSLLTSQDRDGTLFLWQLNDDGSVTKQTTIQGQGPIANYWNLVFSPDGHKIAFQINSNQVGILNTQNGQLFQIIEEPLFGEHSLAFHTDSASLITSSENGRLRVWDAQTGTCQTTLLEEVVGTIALARNGRLAHGGDDGVIRIWNMQTGKHEQTLTQSGPYEGLDITDAVGLSPAQVATLKALGAVSQIHAL